MHTRFPTSAVVLAIIGLLALPGAALGGGWATVQLSSTPDRLAPGATWNVELTILQHGRRPLADLHPTVTIASATGSRTFAARPTGRPGTYRAGVRFPAAGTWRYVIDDGFTARHSYPPVQIGGPAASPAGAAAGAIAFDRLALAALAGIVAAGLALVLARRRRRPAPAGG
jgi:hypothetical protein